MRFLRRKITFVMEEGGPCCHVFSTCYSFFPNGLKTISDVRFRLLRALKNNLLPVAWHSPCVRHSETSLCHAHL
jgi:hypothetical protein